MGLVSQFVIVLLVLALMVAMAIEPTRQLLSQQELITGMKKDLNEVETSNANLRERITRLSDPDFVEQRAREQIGLVREGEITYVVMPPSKPAKSDKKHSKAKKKDVEKAPAPKVVEEDRGFFGGILEFVGL